MKEYQAMFPVQAESLEEAHAIVDEWDTGDSQVRMITGPPETWIKQPEPPPPPPPPQEALPIDGNGHGEV